MNIFSIRTFSGTAFAGACVAALTGCTAKPKPTQRPNIIFIMSDDHSANAISIYDGIYSKVAPTPNIDRIGNEGVRMDDMFCTNSISGPSRACILTGKYSHINGYHVNEGGISFNGDQETLPKQLHESGYTTALVGKWHLASEPQGFDYYKYLLSGGGQGRYWNPDYIENGDTIVEKGYSTNLITISALKWMESVKDKDKPFFLMLQYKAPHRPWQPDSVYLNLFDGKELPYPETFDDDYRTREAVLSKTQMTVEFNLMPTDLKVPAPEGLNEDAKKAWPMLGWHYEHWSPSDTLKGHKLKKWKFQRYIKDYLACIRSVDDNIGKVLKYLDDNGLAENTIIIYTSDQGFFLGEHGLFDKRYMYEESIRMPFVIRYPKVIKGGQIDKDIVTNIDIAPTLLDFAKVSIPADVQGRSFKASLEGNTPSSWPKSMYYHYYEASRWHGAQPHYGIRTERYKLMHFYYELDEWQLFDLQNDPHELNNLYGNPSYKAVVDDLKKQLTTLQQKYSDTLSLDKMREMTSKYDWKKRNAEGLEKKK